MSLNIYIERFDGQRMRLPSIGFFRHTYTSNETEAKKKFFRNIRSKPELERQVKTFLELEEQTPFNEQNVEIKLEYDMQNCDSKSKTDPKCIVFIINDIITSNQRLKHNMRAASERPISEDQQESIKNQQDFQRLRDDVTTHFNKQDEFFDETTRGLVNLENEVETTRGLVNLENEVEPNPFEGEDEFLRRLNAGEYDGGRKKSFTKKQLRKKTKKTKKRNQKTKKRRGTRKRKQ